MSRRFLLVFLAATLIVARYPSRSLSATSGKLIPETTVAEHGLTRAWFTQVGLDQSRGRLRNLVLHDGVLYAQTDRAAVQAIDAETGETLWWKQVGQPKHPSMTPGVCGDLLAVINGTRLYVLNRYTSEVLYEKDLDGAPGAGPALSAKRVYVPLRSGLIVAYRLDPPPDSIPETAMVKTTDEPAPSEADRRKNIRVRQDSPPPMQCQSYGQAMVQPLVTREDADEEYVVWPTDRGFLNVGRVDRSAEDFLTLKYRLETGAAIVGQPAYLPPDPKIPEDTGLIVAASRDGFVYAVQEKNGQLLWRFALGDPIVESPAVFEDCVYASAQLGGMYCLAVKTGKALWHAPDVLQFVAASKARVYVSDRMGRLIVLNAKTGVRLDAIPTQDAPIKLLNTETDRIYLADEGGLIQCLREVDQSEPIAYGEARRQAAKAPTAPAKKAVVAPPEASSKKTPATEPVRAKSADTKNADDAADTNLFGQ